MWTNGPLNQDFHSLSMIHTGMGRHGQRPCYVFHVGCLQPCAWPPASWFLSGWHWQQGMDNRGCWWVWAMGSCSTLLVASPWQPGAGGWDDAKVVTWGSWPCRGPVAHHGASAALCLSPLLFSFLFLLAAASWTPPPRHPARYRPPVLRRPLPLPVTPRHPLCAAGLASAPAPHAGA